MTLPEPMVAVRDLWKRHGGAAVLQGVSLTVPRGQVLCLLGPSGAGKSTLLRCIHGLEQADAGLVLVDGEPIGARAQDGRYHQLGERALSRQRAQIGTVFQTFNLFPHMTALRNIADAPIRVRGEPRAAAYAHAQALLAQVGLQDKAEAYPRQLSGGQQQRVAIARALAMRPKLLLFDEATSALDPRSAGEVLEIMRSLAQTGVTMIVVTHAIDFARAAADLVAILDGGVIIESGPPAQVLGDPAHARTRDFLAGAL